MGSYHFTKALQNETSYLQKFLQKIGCNIILIL
jgi:hypothetical protein